MTDVGNPSRPTPTIAWWSAAVLGTAVLVWLAVAVGLESRSADPWLVALDTAVGVIFIGSALAAPGPWPMRLLVGLTGVLWLLGAVASGALLAHRGALFVALAAFPTGGLRAFHAGIVAAVAMPIALGVLPQGITALLFAAVAAAQLRRRRSFAAAYPVAAAGAVALALGAAWVARSVDPFGYDPVVAEVGYGVVLMLVAIGFAVAMRRVEDRSGVRQRVLEGKALTGLGGLEAVLADSLRDPSIRIYRWDATAHGYVDAGGEPVLPTPPMRWLTVTDGPSVVGAVAHRSPALDDERTAAAVADALRLALLNLQGQHELERQLQELEAARARLLATVDRERAAVARRLEDAVVVPIRDAAGAVRDGHAEASVHDAADALAVALGELDGAADELMQLVQGLGPDGLGSGGLANVLREVSARGPLEVEVEAASDAIGDVTAETALYFVCLEAMTNAAKHASARRLRITIRRDGSTLQAVISDDGVGGADPGGSGFGGLADRLATHGGRLRVESPPGAGTTVTATVPISRSSATPSA